MALLSDKVALVTGSSRGIGAATARLLAANGAAVVVNYVSNGKAAEGVVTDIAALGGKAVSIQGDATDRNQVKAMVEKTLAQFGRIDILVLNAGISFPVMPFMNFRWEDFERKLTHELKAAFFACQEVVPGMIERKSGSIVMVSSGLSRYPGPGFVAHSTAKSGLDAFAKSLAAELGPYGIRVNVIAPGLTETDATAMQPQEMKNAIAEHTPMKRLGQPEDVAGAILMMSCDHTGFVTGTYTPVCGGSQME